MSEALPLLALTMGLMSSFHCIGMCGPIALALPTHKKDKFQQLVGLVAYNGGRTLTYASLGLVLGAAGSAMVWVGYFRYLSILSGAIMLIYVLWPKKMEAYLHVPRFWQHMIQAVKKKMSTVLRSRNPASFVLLGMLNGLLPCGMIYLALMSSLATGSMTGGAIYMLAFGIGTLPAMLAVGFFRQLITPALRSQMHRLTPIVIGITGALLVIRGIMIQYPSNVTGNNTEITICHGK